MCYVLVPECRMTKLLSVHLLSKKIIAKLTKHCRHRMGHYMKEGPLLRTMLLYFILACNSAVAQYIVTTAGQYLSASAACLW